MTAQSQCVLDSIRFHLQGTGAQTNAPTGFDEALSDVCRSKDCPERKLLEQSVHAWVSLLSDQSARASFNSLPTEDRTLLLEGLKNLPPSAATEERVRKIFARKQRQALLKEAGLERLADHDHTDARKRKRNCEGQPEQANSSASPENEEVSVSLTADSGQFVQGNTAECAPVHLQTQIDLSWSGSSYERTKPSARNLRYIFEPRMRDRIIQEDGQASVTIYYAPDLTKCSLRIEVRRNSIHYLVVRLFGCNLIETSMGWVLEIEQGPDVELRGEGGSFKFSRTSVDAIELFIGKRIRELVDYGEESTRLLSLTVWGGGKSDGLIEIQAHADRLDPIALTLWPFLQ
ncbi:hypothetical protein MAN_10069, partial [Metarhizium hybridum]